MKERRQYQRWECRVPCKLTTQGSTLTGEAINLSFEGACIAHSPEKLVKDNEIIVSVDSEAGEISLQARIVYRKSTAGGTRLGIQFLGSWEERLQSLMPFFQDFINKGDLLMDTEANPL